ncbi:MAG: hypothetical protein Q9169_004584 [Polycauliona sp. 2 TL-2023]
MGTYLSPEEIAYQMANINDDRGQELLVSTIVLAVLATVAVILRFISRRVTKVAISWDDGLIVVGLVFLIAMCFCQAYGINWGSGKHVLATVLAPDGEAKIIRYIKIMYAYQIFWALAMVFIKLSILLFYRRVFPSTATSRKWNLCNFALMFLSVACCLISIFGSAFVCTPVALVWDRTIQGGRCIDLIALARFTCISGFVTDILILLLPMPIVWNMHMEHSKKVAVTGVFLLGSLYVSLPFVLCSGACSLMSLTGRLYSVCVASIVRFYYLEQINRDDPTWGNVNSCIWTVVESSVGIISACLPVMAPFLRSKIAAVATSIFRSKTSGQASVDLISHGATNAHKEKRGFSRLGRVKTRKTGSSSQGSDRDPEVGLESQSQAQEQETKNEGNFGIGEPRR